MTKRELIDQIMSLNPSAQAAFLARFGQDELLDYLRQLRALFREGGDRELLTTMAVATD